MSEHFSPENIDLSTNTIKEKENKEKKTFLENLRLLPRSLKFIIFLGSLDISLWLGKRSLDYYDLKTAQEIVDEGLQKYSSSQEKIEKVVELFGNHAYIIPPDYENLKKEKNRLDSKEENFSFIGNTDFTRREEHIPSVRRMTESKPVENYPDDFTASELVSSQDTLSGGDFKAIAEQTYPDGWVGGEITSISQKDERKNIGGEIGGEYGLEGEAWASCISTSTGYGYDSEIVFHGWSYYETLYSNINEAFSHEIAHANDWEVSNDLSFEDRASFLLAIVERVQSEDRFHSTYVESIKNEDKQLELHNKCKEYWAEICEQYFGGSAQNLNYKDVQLIESVVKKEDPNFDPLDAYTKRTNSIIAYGYKLRDPSSFGEDIVKQ